MPDAEADTGSADTLPDTASDTQPDTRADSSATDTQPEAEAPLDTQTEAGETGCSSAGATTVGWLPLLLAALLRRRRNP
jgi:uncharacterized protein (TIGR03382 family)